MAASIPASTLDRFATFGDLLRFLRRRVSITQVELANSVGYSHAQISRLEQNLRLPDIPTIEARFVPALALENEPRAVARLLDLAANVRREDAPAAGGSPYKGLSYFDEADADLFVGREELTATLAHRVLALAEVGPSPGSRFLAVIGASGSGKSSLLRAGLIPALRRNTTSAEWQIHMITPGANPLENLAASLTHSVSATAGLMDDMARDPRALHLFARQSVGQGKTPHLVIMVDQFEELFTLCRSEAGRAAFVDNLRMAASEPGGRAIVVIALRADFYAHCAEFPALRVVLARQQEYIGPMDDPELRRAIEEPARRGRWELEQGLVDLVLRDVGHEPGALPLLSHALLETWERRRGRTLTLSGYASSGGVRGAIAETAEAVFSDQFTLDQQQVARRIFLRLTELGEETASGGTRRRANLDELILRPEEADRTQSVLKTLADARLITTSEDSVEVAHEALIREWPRLRTWLEDNKESLRFHRHLTGAAQDWAASHREPDVLYRGARLTQAREWAFNHSNEVNDLESQFIGASQAAAEREALEREAQRDRELEVAQSLAQEQVRSADRLRARNRILRTFGGAALLLALLAGWFGIQAELSATRARADFARAESLRLAADAQAILLEDGDPQTAALLSIRALQNAYSFQADSALSHSLEHLYLRRVFRGHTGWIYSVAFSPDGKYMLTGSQDGTARMWDVETGQEVRRFVGHRGGIADAEFSPDGQRVITGGNDSTARIWDAGTGQQLLVFEAETGGNSSVAFSPDGRYVVTAGGENLAALWDASTGRQIRVFAGHTAFVGDAVFSSDDRYLLTGGFDSTARLWDIATGVNLRIFNTSDRVNSVALSKDHRYVLTGNDDRVAESWNIESGRRVCTFTGHTDRVNAVTFSTDGRYVATGSNDRTARVWDARTCQQLRRFDGSEADVQSVAFSPDGGSVLAGGGDNLARLWAAPASLALRRLVCRSTAPCGITSVAFSPDGAYVLAGGEDHRAHLWEARSGTELRTFIGHSATVASVAFSPDGTQVLTGSVDRTARLWDASTGDQQHVVATMLVTVASVAFSPDGQLVLTTGMGSGGGASAGLTSLWEAGSGQLVRTYDIETGAPDRGYLSALAFSPDGRLMLVMGYNGATMLETATGQMIRLFMGYGGTMRSVAFSPDGRHVLTGNEDKTARLWELHTGELVRVFRHQTGMVYDAVFSPNGELVLAGLSDGTAHLWSVETGEEVRQYTGHLGAVNSVAVSPDGKWALTGSQDGTARLWDIDIRDTLRFACSLLGRDLTAAEKAQYDIHNDAPTCPALES